MSAEILDSANLPHAVETAVRLLREGLPVALPTETVYGLAADALSAAAAARIFEAKERPLDDPLIVHLPSREWLDRLTAVPPASKPLVDRLIAKYWPGPLTLVLPRSAIVPDIVTAGEPTLAVRMSAHPVFRAVCEAFGGPLAAPSANRFGKVSPTTAQHAFSELGDRIPCVVDGGPCQHGIESTIVAMEDGALAILRHGPITEEELCETAEITSLRHKIAVPGGMKSHYAPRKPLVLVENLGKVSPSRSGLLAWEGGGEAYKKTVKLSEHLDLREAAANLYAAMRMLDESDVDVIVVEPVPEAGIGRAIMDRLRKAAARE